MGMCTSRNKESNKQWEKDPKVFIHKMKLLQQEINGILEGREEESEAYERELMHFAVKEAEWKKERKKLKDEVKKMRKKLEEKEEKIRMMEDEVDQIVGKNNNGQFEGKSSVGHSSCVTGSSVNMSLMEQMKEERARRDETVEKWKMLYLDIKNELDELILKTHQGTLNWRGEEDLLVEQMQRELKAKNEIIEVLKAQTVSLESETYKRKREVDILRQSLKIISSKKGPTSGKHVKSRSRASIRLNKSLSKLAFVN